MGRLGKLFEKASQYHNNLTIRNKMLLFNVLIIFVPIFALALVANSISTNAIVNKATDNSKHELTLILKNLESWVNHFEGYSRLLSSDYRLQQLLGSSTSSDKEISSIDVKKSLNDIISNYAVPNVDMITASIMTRDRSLFNVGYADNTVIGMKFDQSLYEDTVRKQHPVWTGLFRFKYTYSNDEDNVFAVAKSIIDKTSGLTLGISIIYIKESNVAAVYTDYDMDSANSFYIIDSDNRVISTRNKTDLYQDFNNILHAQNFSFSSHITDGSQIVTIKGVRSLINVRSFDKLNWKIVNIVPLDQITSENKRINRLIVSSGFICLIIAYIGAFLLSHTISRPILRLSKFMKTIKPGDADVRANFSYGGEIGTLVGGFNQLLDRNELLLQEVYAEQKARREYAFRLIQSQIKPHFLYNTLETIISFIKLDMYAEAISSTKYLAGFYRISLSKGNDIISIAEEIELIKNYLGIQTFRYSFVEYQIDVDQSILGSRIPKLTLQPIVENAIYHGIKPKRRGTIVIKGYRQRTGIVLEIVDDGVGMTVDTINKVLQPPDAIDIKKNFGVSSVDARIKLLYGERYGLVIESILGEYTKVLVILPQNGVHFDVESNDHR